MKYFLKLKFLFIFICCCSLLFAKDFTRKERKLIEKYQSFLTKGATIDNIGYCFIFEKKDSIFIKKIINPDKLVKTHEIRFWDSNRIVKHGDYKEWYDNGNIWKQGKYIYGKKQGLWRYYSHSKKGKQVEVGIFIDDKKEGIWTWQKENTREITHYKNGEKDGIYECYEKNLLVKKIIYKSDKVDSVIFEDNMQKSEKPKFRTGEKGLLEIITKKIDYPMYAEINGLQGKVIVNFAVEKDGSIGDIVVLRGVCKSLENKVVKEIKTLPRFKSPGKIGGKAVKMWFQLPIYFSTRDY